MKIIKKNLSTIIFILIFLSLVIIGIMGYREDQEIKQPKLDPSLSFNFNVGEYK